MLIVLEFKHCVKSLMEQVLLACLVQPAHVYRITVCFSVFFVCGTVIPCLFYSVLVGRAVSIFSIGIHVGVHVEYCRFVDRTVFATCFSGECVIIQSKLA